MSNDMFLGHPYNVASYALLLGLICEATGCTPNHLIINIADCHLYVNHIEQAKLQMTRKPFTPPTIKINRGVMKELMSEPVGYFDLDFEKYGSAVNLQNYKSHDSIKGEVAV